MTDHGKPPVRRGRPRTEGVDDVILDAALHDLASVGYSRMTVAGVALRAGVTKPTLYRRWRGKDDLATAALAKLQQTDSPMGTGSTRGDVLAVLHDFRQKLLRPMGFAMIGTLLTEERSTPQLMKRFRERVVVPRRAQLAAILAGAMRRGELRSDVDVEVVVSMLIGSFYAKYLADGQIPEDWPNQVVDAAWPTIVAAPPSRGPSGSGIL